MHSPKRDHRPARRRLRKSSGSVRRRVAIRAAADTRSRSRVGLQLRHDADSAPGFPPRPRPPAPRIRSTCSEMRRVTPSFTLAANRRRQRGKINLEAGGYGVGIANIPLGPGQQACLTTGGSGFVAVTLLGALNTTGPDPTRLPPGTTSRLASVAAPGFAPITPERAFDIDPTRPASFSRPRCSKLISSITSRRCRPRS